jgi:hypothetical protein
MGGFVAFQSAGDAQADGAFERACAAFAESQALPEQARVRQGAAYAAKFGRHFAPATPAAEDARGWVVAAGTWHHPDLSRPGDTAGLLGLLGAHGADVLERLEGMYAVVWHDAASDTLTAATDLLGRLHLFEAEHGDGVLLATSATACAAVAGSDPDPVAVSEFLASGNFYEDRTAFARVRRLPGGRVFRYRAGRRVETSQQRLLPCAGADGPDARETIDRLLAAFDAGLGAFLPAYDHPLADLTGGMDSRLVVGLMQRAGASFDVTVSGAATHPDVRTAGKLAGRLGLRLVHETDTVKKAAAASFPTVMRAAALTDGRYDPIEYASILASHEPHAQKWSASFNGSGGEMFRNYWWSGATALRTDLDPVAHAVRRFAGTAVAPPFLKPEHRREAGAHFREVVSRSLAARAGEPFHSQMDHVYLDLRMQCWQGAIASATNRLWPNLSPLLWAEPLKVLFAAPPGLRAGGRLVFSILERFPRTYRTTPLETGLPAMAPRAGNVWRFLPGWGALPFHLWPRVKRRLLPAPGPDPAVCERVRRLMADGLSDYLDPGATQLLPLLDRDAYERFLRTARESGAVSSALLGRLTALESSLRAARGMTGAAP